MPIDPAMLATSIGALADLDPEPDLPASLQRAVTAAKQLLDADAAGIHAHRRHRGTALGQRV
jgi:uncharacterized protein (DUF849 family)